MLAKVVCNAVLWVLFSGVTCGNLLSFIWLESCASFGSMTEASSVKLVEHSTAFAIYIYITWCHMYVREMGRGFIHDQKGAKKKTCFFPNLFCSDVILGWAFITNWCWRSSRSKYMKLYYSVVCTTWREDFVQQVSPHQLCFILFHIFKWRNSTDQTGVLTSPSLLPFMVGVISFHA